MAQYPPANAGVSRVASHAKRIIAAKAFQGFADLFVSGASVVNVIDYKVSFLFCQAPAFPM